MKKFLICMMMILFAASVAYAETMIEGYEYTDSEVHQYHGITTTDEPAVSPSGQARTYYNSTDNELKVSYNGGAYAAWQSASSGAVTATTDGGYLDGDLTISQSLSTSVVYAQTISMVGDGLLEGLDSVDATTETTLEAALDVASVGESLSNLAAARLNPYDGTVAKDIEVNGDLSVSANATVYGNLIVYGAISGDPDAGDTSFAVEGDLSVSNDVTVKGILQVEGSMYAGDTSYSKGLYLSYTGTNTIDIKPGEIVCNNNYYKLLSAYSMTVSTIASGEDYHYIYVDDSDSSSPLSLSFTDSTTEPTYDDTKLGWYNGDDRCIGAVYSLDSVSAIRPFSCSREGYITWGNVIQLASSMDPNDNWQSPDDANASDKLPVNAIEALTIVSGADSGSDCRVFAAEAEQQWLDIDFPYSGQLRATSYGGVAANGWIKLGPSRNIVFAGVDNDDNNLDGYIGGYRCEV